MSINLPNLPNCVKLFLTEMDKHIEGVTAIQEGKILIELKSEVIKSPENYRDFILYFNAAKAKYRAIANYTNISFKNTVMDVISKTLHGMQIEINVRELLMDRLSFFFRPDNDFSIGDSINFLLSCGLSDLDLMNSLNIPRTTYRRYRNHGVINSKTKMDTLEMKQKTELATVLN